MALNRIDSGSASVARSITMGALAIGASMICAVAAAQAGPKSDDGILVLSSKHIGMTSDEIAKSEEPVQEIAAPEGAVANEWQSDHTEAPKCPAQTVTVIKRSALDFNGCVETAIRAGNGYSESSRVCRSLVPEKQVAADASTPAPAPEAAAESEAAPKTEASVKSSEASVQ